jgi:hypothetical protein
MRAIFLLPTEIGELEQFFCEYLFFGVDRSGTAHYYNRSILFYLGKMKRWIFEDHSSNFFLSTTFLTSESFEKSVILLFAFFFHCLFLLC